RGERLAALLRPAAPIRSCSRWGLPCHPRCRGCGALLPHPFTLTQRTTPRGRLAAAPRLRGGRCRRGGLLSVALSLGSPPPGVTRHRLSVEPGLSSPRRSRGAAVRPSGHPKI